MSDRSERVSILHLEDDPADGELVKASLQGEGFDVRITLVDSRAAFERALAENTYSLVLSDFSLPGFDGLSALRHVRSTLPDLPFIMVSGQLGEEAAVESVRSGATDYVLKERLIRLGPAVTRALAEAEERAARRRAESELAQAEAQLRQSQKMEAIGRLAGGVAHDFNNLLTVVNGYAEMLDRKVREPAARADIAQIRNAAGRAAGLTRQLLAFSRNETVDPKVFDLNAEVMTFQRMLERVIGADVHFKTSLMAVSGFVMADPIQVDQIVLNLCVNARDAMPSGGIIAIDTRNVELDKPHDCGGRVVGPGSWVVLSIHDTGTGISPDNLHRIFEPFFTTKNAGHGTGLGLSTVQGIVQQSRGVIGVQSVVGSGTRFEIFFPRVSDKGDHDTAPLEDVVVGGTETVLIVEDENMMLQLLAESLESAGYDVVAVRNREAAVQVLERRVQNQEPINLILSDLVMPGMSGRDLNTHMARLGAGCPVLYMSGYYNAAQFQHVVKAEDVLHKPFRVEELLKRIRDALDARKRKAS